MKTLDIAPTDCTPGVTFDASTRTLLVEGESYPEDVHAFFSPIRSWVVDIIETGAPIHLDLSLDYLNTSSAKALVDLLKLLNSYYAQGGDARITWRHQPGVEVMREAGEELAHDLQLPFVIEPAIKEARSVR